MEFSEEFLKERYERLEDDIKEMNRNCRETHSEVSQNFTRTIESVHMLAREVNGKVTQIHTSINGLKVDVERNQNKQKFYVITVLVSVIILILSSFGGFVYNHIEHKQDIIQQNATLEKKIDSILEAHGIKK